MVESATDINKEVWFTLRRQLLSFWELNVDEESMIQQYIQKALDQVNEAYGKSNRIYYKKYGFSVLNTTVYAVFLYYLAHFIGCDGRGGG